MRSIVGIIWLSKSYKLAFFSVNTKVIWRGCPRKIHSLIDTYHHLLNQNLSSAYLTSLQIQSINMIQSKS